MLTFENQPKDIISELWTKINVRLKISIICIADRLQGLCSEWSTFSVIRIAAKQYSTNIDC